MKGAHSAAASRLGNVSRLPVITRTGPASAPKRARSLPVLNVATNPSMLTPPRPVNELPLPDGSFWSYVPVVGETIEYSEKGPLGFWEDRSAKFGPVFRTHYLGKTCYMVGDYASIERALFADQKFTRIDFPSAFNEIIGDDGFMTKKELNQTLRRLATQAFGPKAMNAYSLELSDIIEPSVAEASAVESFDVYKTVSSMTVDFALRLVCGLPSDDPVAREIIRTMTPLLLIGVFTPLPKWKVPGLPHYEGMKARKEVRAVLGRLIAPRKAKIIENATSTEKFSDRSFVTQFIKAKIEEGVDDVFDDEVLADIFVNIVMASFDTSKSSLLVLLSALAMAPPRVMERLRAEQREVVAKHGEAFTGAAFADMDYALAFAKETTRAFSHTSMLTRVVIQDFELHGRRIPAGSTLLLNLIAASAKEDALPEHERGVMYKTLCRETMAKTFRPERWLADSDAVPVHSVFGMGPHFCLGAPLYNLEAKALLATIARGYDIAYDGDGIDFDRAPLIVPHSSCPQTHSS